MTHQDVEDFANALIAKHLGGKPWKFKWLNTATTFGRCDERDWSISVSRKTFDALVNKEDVKQTILHEIAHGIVGCVEGHNATWAKCAAHLGVKNPSATSNYKLDRKKMGYTYCMITICDTEVRAHAYYTRKPRKDLRGVWIGSDKSGTQDRVWHCAFSDLVKYEQGDSSLQTLKRASWK